MMNIRDCLLRLTLMKIIYYNGVPLRGYEQLWALPGATPRAIHGYSPPGFD
jgi:hypothetical protein